MRRKWLILSAGLLWCLVLVSGTALASISTATLTVSAEISQSCNINSITDVDFGLYDPLRLAPSEATGSFSFICPPATSYELYISGLRQMRLGADALDYELYTDDARTTAWPGAAPSTETGFVLSPDVITRNVYGRLLALQFAPMGPYESFVTIVINF